MSYDLYLWKWGRDPHMSAGICYLLMQDGLECEDAEVLDGRKLRAQVLRRVSPIARSADGQVECEVLPRGLILEAHGVGSEALFTALERVVHRESLVVFDPQTDPVTEEEAAEAERFIQAQKAADELVRLQTEIPDLSARAQAGDGHALVELGNRYFFGEAVPRDRFEAFRCYLRAAEAGNDAGMLNVASCYRQGDGTPRDIVTALTWYDRALQTDRTFAPFELGEMYEKGDGVKGRPVFFDCSRGRPSGGEEGPQAPRRAASSAQGVRSRLAMFVRSNPRLQRTLLRQGYGVHARSASPPSALSRQPLGSATESHLAPAHQSDPGHCVSDQLVEVET
jgi:hypothetical protein